MDKEKHNYVLRWIALSSVVLNVVFNYLYMILPLGLSRMDEISDSYASRFSPAGYAFSIWGIIYLSFIIYAIAALLPSQLGHKVYDRLAPYFTGINILASAWVFSFGSNKIGLSLIIIIAMLLCGAFSFALAKDEYMHKGGSFRITIPFSLFLGWITVATFANVSIYLISQGWQSNVFGEPVWVSLMIVAAFLLAIVVSIAFLDFIYPLVVAWATIAIWVANKNYNDATGKIALGCGIVLALWGIAGAIRQLRTQQKTHSHMEA